MRLAVAAAFAVLLLLPPPTSGHEDPLLVYVRVEGRDANVFRGWIELPGTLTFPAYNSGRTYAVHGHTPLGALVAASQAAGFAALVTDEFRSIDFSVDAVAGEWQNGTYWWDYRVNYVSTYYGAHHGWLGWGPGLRTGHEVLWYLETIGTAPLRGSAAPLGACAHAARADLPFPDTPHRSDQPWPTPNWVPATGATLEPFGLPFVAGATVASAPPGGTEAWAEAVRTPLMRLDLVRSDRVTLACPTQG